MVATIVVGLVTLGNPARVSGGYLYHRHMAARAEQHGARLVFASFPEWPFPLGLLAGPAVLSRALTSGAEALLLDSIAAAFVGPWLLRGPARPLIGVLHQPPGGVGHHPLRTALQRRLDWLAYRRARLLIVASALLAEMLQAQGVPPGRLRVVPPGCNLPRPTTPAGDLRRGRQAALLCVANWVPSKGVHSLLEAVAALPEPAATLHLVGDDRVERSYAARLRVRLAQPQLAGRVVVHGAVTQVQLAALYRAADIFVLPSFFETFGTACAEAMAAGLPVVGYQAGNLPRLIEHGRDGLLVPPGDVHSLTLALAHLIDDATLRRAMGSRARERAASCPTWAESAAHFFEAVRAAIEEPNGGART